MTTDIKINAPDIHQMPPADHLFDLLVSALQEALSNSQVISEHPYTEDEAAALLRVKPQTMRHWRTQGRGPTYIKIGRSVRYRQQDMAEYIETHLVRTSK